MENQAQKYKIIDPKSKDFGKKIKALPNELLSYVDVKTGKVYDINQLQKLPERHAFYGGVKMGRFGVFIFGREYWRYRTFQFGLSVDWIRGADTYLDIEAHAFCFGFGVRFVWIAKVN